MMKKNPLIRLMETNPFMEIWWDSSPLVLEHWISQFLNRIEPEIKPQIEEYLGQLFNKEEPMQGIFRGCTTNPPLSLRVVETHREHWDRWVDELISQNSDLEEKELFWLTYKEIVYRGAQQFLSMFKASGGKYGWISAQLDPRLATEKDIMIKQARELSSLSPNVMIKVPATKEGIEVIEELTSMGISTNTTVCFTLPQIIASAEAAYRGVERAKQKKVDLTRWRAVITMMIGRLTERADLDKQAEKYGITLTRQDKHWFGISVFRRAYRLLQDFGYPSKLLACSLRAGPLVAGRPRFWDIEKIAGGEIVFTLPPYVLEPFFLIGDGLEFKPEIEEPVPTEIMDKLLKIPYCLQAYEPNGLSPDQFNTHPATLYTLSEFSKASDGLEEYIAQRLAKFRKTGAKNYREV